MRYNGEELRPVPLQQPNVWTVTENNKMWAELTEIRALRTVNMRVYSKVSRLTR